MISLWIPSKNLRMGSEHRITEWQCFQFANYPEWMRLMHRIPLKCIHNICWSLCALHETAFEYHNYSKCVYHRVFNLLFLLPSNGSIDPSNLYAPHATSYLIQIWWAAICSGLWDLWHVMRLGCADVMTRKSVTRAHLRRNEKLWTTRTGNGVRIAHSIPTNRFAFSFFECINVTIIRPDFDLIPNPIGRPKMRSLVFCARVVLICFKRNALIANRNHNFLEN